MRERPKFDGRTLKRLLSYMRAYKGTLVLVTVCILLSAVAGAASSMFLQKLIDGYIVPMLGTASPDFSGLIRALITIGVLFLVQQIDGLVISPRVMGSVTGFSPGTVLLALYFGSKLGGIGGLLLAVPALTAIRTLYRVFVQRYEKN